MSFSEASLLRKIQELNNTQQSVQTLSLWLIHHRKYSKIIVQSWFKELIVATNCDRKITYIYLANDILQNSRKKGAEFTKEFLLVLPDAIENTSKIADTKTRFTLERIFNIWKDRKIFSDEIIKKLKTVLHSQPKLDENSPSESAGIMKNTSKSAISVTKTQNESEKKKISSKDDDIRKRKNSDETAKTESTGESLSKVLKKSLKEEVMKELANNNTTIQAPEPLELISMLQELEKSASSDAVIRQKIAELPPKVIDANGVKNLKDKKVAAELLIPVNEAAKLVDDYNYRLQQELANRKQTALLLAAYIQQKRAENENAKADIEEWQQRLKNVKNVENELHVHLKSLPDLSSIEEAAILKPLPSAGDLFSS